jgi:hypothetical protein
VVGQVSYWRRLKRRCWRGYWLRHPSSPSRNSVVKRAASFGVTLSRTALHLQFELVSSLALSPKRFSY